MWKDRKDDLLKAIPMLRYYAFCLTGSWEAGDDWIEQTILNIAGKRVSLDGTSVMITLFRAFHETPANAGNFEHLRDSHSGPEDVMVDSDVLALPVPYRRAFLLVKSMGFTHAEGAEILGLPTEDVRQLTNAASQRLSGKRRSTVTVQEESKLAL